MEIKVQLNNLRIAPRKTRMVADVVRGKNVVQARALLEFTVKRGADPILKLMNSAVASAKNLHQLQEENLYISKITVDEGPKLKRMMPVSRGRGHSIFKRTSHIALVLSERKQDGVLKPKKKVTKESNKKV